MEAGGIIFLIILIIVGVYFLIDWIWPYIPIIVVIVGGGGLLLFINEYFNSQRLREYWKEKELDDKIEILREKITETEK